MGARHAEGPAGSTESPCDTSLWCADAAALVGLKAQAFGRTRPDGAPVERDYSDVVLLLDHTLEEIVEQTENDAVMRSRALGAARILCEDQSAIAAAVRQLTSSGAYGTPLSARQATIRAATRALRALSR